MVELVEAGLERNDRGGGSSECFAFLRRFPHVCFHGSSPRPRRPAHASHPDPRPPDVCVASLWTAGSGSGETPSVSTQTSMELGLDAPRSSATAAADGCSSATLSAQSFDADNATPSSLPSEPGSAVVGASLAEAGCGSVGSAALIAAYQDSTCDAAHSDEPADRVRDDENKRGAASTTSRNRRRQVQSESDGGLLARSGHPSPVWLGHSAMPSRDRPRHAPSGHPSPASAHRESPQIATPPFSAPHPPSTPNGAESGGGRERRF